MTKQDTRSTLEDLTISRFFWAPSFEIYGGVAGLYDLGPPGAIMEQNILARWREWFVIEEEMSEVRCTALTPTPVLEASGHTSKFNDFMFSDTKTSKLFRVDKYIEEFLSKLPPSEEIDRTKKRVAEMQLEELKEVIEKFKIVSPEKNPLSEPVPFNLMFNTAIGPGLKAIPGHLRPETAQGIFVNFPRLYQFNGNKLPFAAAQTGVSYRNEIAPRNELVRCREFMMAEIEHFADPTRLNDCPKFQSVASLEVTLFSIDSQLNGNPALMTFSDAVSQNIIAHKTLAYFMGRTYLFLLSIGIAKDRLRFRQHLPHEKAHYAKDCWDAEIFVNGDWLECVGLADRQSYDLTQHTDKILNKSEPGEKGKSKKEKKSPLIVSEPLEVPITKEEIIVKPVMKEIAKAFRKDAKEIEKELMNVEKKQQYFDQFSSENVVKIGEFVLNAEMVSVVKENVVTKTREYIPCVIEPSFGIGRIMTGIIEHNFYLREDKIRRVLSLKPSIAPFKVCIFTISVKLVPQENLLEVIEIVKKAHLSYQVDSTTASIGKRYSRSDELGTPFGITVDVTTLTDKSVTLRERDSMKQVRLSVAEAVQSIVLVISNLSSWEEISSKYPAFSTLKEDE